MSKDQEMTCRCGGRMTTAKNRKEDTRGAAWVVYRRCAVCGSERTDTYTWSYEYAESAPAGLPPQPGEGGMEPK